MNVQNDNSQRKGIDISLVGEARIHRHQHHEIILHGHRQKLVVLVILPPEKLGGIDIVFFREKGRRSCGML